MSLKPKIIAYLKQECGWSKGVRSVLDKYNFTYNMPDRIVDNAGKGDQPKEASGREPHPSRLRRGAEIHLCVDPPIFRKFEFKMLNI